MARIRQGCSRCTCKQWAQVCFSLALLLLPVPSSSLLPQPVYPLFAIANKRDSASWSVSDVQVVASSFILADGIPTDNATLLAMLTNYSSRNTEMISGEGGNNDDIIGFKPVRYCNPRGIALTGPVVDPNVIMPLSEFELHHRREAMFYTVGFLAEAMDDSSSSSVTMTDVKLTRAVWTLDDALVVTAHVSRATAFRSWLWRGLLWVGLGCRVGWIACFFSCVTGNVSRSSNNNETTHRFTES